jgi:hypothetical protein
VGKVLIQDAGSEVRLTNYPCPSIARRCERANGRVEAQVYHREDVHRAEQGATDVKCAKRNE